MTWMSDYAANKRGMLGIDGAYSNGMINIQGGGSSSGDAIKQLALGSVFNILGGAAELAAYSIAMKGAGGIDGSAVSGKQISKACQTIISTYPTKIATSVMTFNTKYAAAGITMNADGTTSQSYEARLQDLNNKIAEHKKSVTAGSDGEKNLKAYNDAKACHQSLENAKKSYDALQSTIDTKKTDSDISVSGDKATAKEVNVSDFYIYLTPEEQKAGNIDTLAKNTNAYKAEEQKRKAKADEYNNLIQQQKDILSGVKDIDGKPISSPEELKNAITNANKKVTELAEKNVNNNQNCGQYDATLESYNKQIKALGTKADFDKAVKEVTDMRTELEDATKIANQEQSVNEANNAVKNTRKKGSLLHKVFGKNPQKAAHKDAKTERDSQQALLREMYSNLSNKYS